MSTGTTPYTIPHITGHVYPDSQLNQTLFSVADYCNQGCIAMFDSTGFKILSPAEGEVRPVTVPNMDAEPVSHTTAHVVRHQMNADFVAFAHAAMVNPTYTTFLTAVRRGYLRMRTWLDLTVRRIQHDPPRSSVATAAGHLDLI
jgi:hypothetical protein